MRVVGTEFNAFELDFKLASEMLERISDVIPNFRILENRLPVFWGELEMKPAPNHAMFIMQIAIAHINHQYGKILGGIAKRYVKIFPGRTLTGSSLHYWYLATKTARFIYGPMPIVFSRRI